MLYKQPSEKNNVVFQAGHRYNQPPSMRNIKQPYLEIALTKSLILRVCTLLLFFAGCAQQQQAVELCVPPANKALLMHTAEDVLTELHFTIDKVDAEKGFLSTRPLPGAQFFEFWRKDNVGPFNAMEANLHSIRRSVELTVNQAPGKPSGQLCLNCNVITERLSIPQRQVSDSAPITEMFSQDRLTAHELEFEKNRKKDIIWLPLGKDTELGYKIVALLKNRLEKLQKDKKL